jgi:biotin carboxylase
VRLLILASKLGYQTRGFAEAAERLGVEVVFGTDRCHQLDDPWQDGAVPLHFEHPEQEAAALAQALQGRRVHGVLALGDRPTTTAAFLARELGLPFHSPDAVKACRSKLSQREVLRAVGLPVPEFFSFALDDDLSYALPHVRFPCVVKPFSLAGSQGVIRANDAQEFAAAIARLARILEQPDVQVTREPGLARALVESYIPGEEVAVECLLDRGRLRVLAIFDKPDPLEGPFFEETIYVTPSRQPPEVQRRIIALAEQMVRALGLSHGPAHLEFRINQAGVWILEAAARPIGGLCSRALRFGAQRMLLEELLVRHALGMDGAQMEREADASGVMMIPVPRSGMLAGVEGTEEAKGVVGVEELHITARLHDYIAAWPEGSSYLGFLLARAQTPEGVESALRAAHGKLRFTITPRLPVGHPVTGKIPREP